MIFFHRFFDKDNLFTTISMLDMTLVYQKEIVDERLAVNKKIKADEWVSIMVFSKISLQKQIEKEQKKLEKNKDKGKYVVPIY